MSILLLLVFLAAPPLSADAPVSRTQNVLWTTCTVTLYDHGTQQALDASFQRLQEIHDRMSTNVPGSQLDEIAAEAGKAPVRVTDDVFLVAQKALEFARLTDGLFDPTVGPLVKAWRFDKDDPRIPAPADIQAALSLVNWKDVVLDDKTRTVYLARPSMQLDFGGLIKGYAADEVARILTAQGVHSAIIDLGGDIYALGNEPSGSPWRIGVQNPDADRGVSFAIASITSQSIVTSGVYEHYFTVNGRRYSHIINTRTGYPVDNGLASVTVISSHSIDADGLGLSLFCLGVKDGLALGEKLGLGVIMVDSSHRVYATSKAREVLAITDPDFGYAN